MPDIRTALRRHISGVTLVSVVALAAVLRFPTLGTQSLWTDEGNTVAWLHGSFAQMLSGVAHNESSPPLYFCVAWLWAKIFGDWIVALRALSALLGCATVAVAYRGAERLYGTRVAAILGLLMATSATLIWYSQEARQYALLLLLCTLGLVLWARVLLLRERRAIVWWAAISGLALATHYFALLIVVPEAAVLLLRAPRTRSAAVAALTVLAFVAALLPFALYQRSRTNISWIAASGSLISRLKSTEGLLLANGGAGISHAWWLGLLFAVVAIALGLWRGRRDERQTVVSAVALAAAVIVLAVLAAALGFDYVLPRHLLPAYLPLLVAIAVSLGAAGAGRFGLLVAAAGCAFGVAITLSINNNIAYQREDIRDVARSLGAASPAQVVIFQRPDNFLLANAGLPAFRYYATTLRRITAESRRVGEVDLVDEGIPPRDVAPAIRGLGLLGFRLVGAERLGKFRVYELAAAHEIDVATATLRRDARFAGADPLLLVR